MATVAPVVRPMSVIGALFGYAFWKDDEQAGSYRFVGRIRTENALVLIEKFSGTLRGTIPEAVRQHSVPNDVCRHRLISISYISLLPSHGTVRWIKATLDSREPGARDGENCRQERFEHSNPALHSCAISSGAAGVHYVRSFAGNGQ